MSIMCALMQPAKALFYLNTIKILCSDNTSTSNKNIEFTSDFKNIFNDDTQGNSISNFCEQWLKKKDEYPVSIRFLLPGDVNKPSDNSKLLNLYDTQSVKIFTNEEQQFSFNSESVKKYFKTIEDNINKIVVYEDILNNELYNKVKNLTEEQSTINEMDNLLNQLQNAKEKTCDLKKKVEEIMAQIQLDIETTTPDHSLWPRYEDLSIHIEIGDEQKSEAMKNVILQLQGFGDCHIIFNNHTNHSDGEAKHTTKKDQYLRCAHKIKSVTGDRDVKIETCDTDKPTQEMEQYIGHSNLDTLSFRLTNLNTSAINSLIPDETQIKNLINNVNQIKHQAMEKNKVNDNCKDNKINTKENNKPNKAKDNLKDNKKSPITRSLPNLCWCGFAFLITTFIKGWIKSNTNSSNYRQHELYLDQQ